MRKVKENSDFIPCKPEIGDEILGGYPFKWNVTAVSAWIEKNLNQVELSTVQVNPPSPGVDSENLDEEFIPKADLTRPIIIVRMSGIFPVDRWESSSGEGETFGCERITSLLLDRNAAPGVFYIRRGRPDVCGLLE